MFTAQIIGGELAGDPFGRRPQRRMRFRVLEHFKGEIPFDALVSSGDSGSCGVSLQVGDEYLIFTDDYGGISLCSGLQRLSDPEAQRELEILREHRAGNMPVTDPWSAYTHAGGCTARTTVTLPHHRVPSTLSLTFALEQDGVRSTATVRNGLYQLPLAGTAVALTLGERRWELPWVPPPPSENRYARGQYRLEGDAALSLARWLAQAASDSMAISFESAQHGLSSMSLWVAHARPVFEEFLGCIESSDRAGN
ncbi:MAG: hypothetical protein AAF184_22810 [Pseudomonadota bacterium]